MTVRIEKKGKVWTVIHSRREARNAMDPESADALVSAFKEFDKDPNAAVAVLWGEGGAVCAGWGLKYCSHMIKDVTQLHEIDYPLDDRQPIPRGPLGPTRLELDKPVIAAVAGPAVAGGVERAAWCGCRGSAAWGAPWKSSSPDARFRPRKRCASAPASMSSPTASRASSPRRWRTTSRASRRRACAPTGARLTCSRG